jgi:diguanylate cyclase (GGDEF)-like protein
MRSPDADTAIALLEGWRSERRRLLDLLSGFTSVVVAVFSPSGDLIEANRGYALVTTGRRDASAPPGADALVAPTFDELASSDPGTSDSAYAGIVTLTGADAAPRSLNGVLWRFPDAVVLLAEHDVADHHATIDALLGLHEEMSELQRELLRSRRALERSEARLREQATTDDLTGLRNRRFATERLAEEVARSRREGSELCVAIVDLDHLKHHNDAHGHRTGDVALQTVAELLRGAARSYDVCARYGGDEFVLVWTDTGPDDALRAAQRLIGRARELRVADAPLSLSIGVATLADDDTPDSLLARADDALYDAKRGGRDRACRR